MKMPTCKCTYCSQEDKTIFIAESVIRRSPFVEGEMAEDHPDDRIMSEDDIARAICIDCARNIYRAFQSVAKFKPEILVGRE